jgi:hypothetical protein
VVFSVRLTIFLLATWCLCCVESASTADELDAEARAQWRHVFDGVAADYKISRASETRSLALIDRPTYTWARSGPHGGTYGAVYVWTDRGNADAVACFWRNPGTDGTLFIVHELHSLSPVVLNSTGKESDSWKPKAGLKRYPLADVPAPVASATGRMQQMRTFCRDFSAKSVSSRGERTELRLLPQPLYRYESINSDVVDGALFAFVCSIGTDPEAFLLLEAINEAEGPRWNYALARFSHMNLFVNIKDREVWQAIRDQGNTLSHNADHTYWVFPQPFDRTMFDATKHE